jgi:hypothetical protein
MKRAILCIPFVAVFSILLYVDESESHDDKFRIAVIESEHGGYGYDIFINDKLSIHQPHIPALAGIRGFASFKDAQQTAEAVVKKLKQKENPPTITVEELATMGVVSNSY